MTVQTLIQSLVFAAYIGYVWGRFGVLDSISASYYKLRENHNWLFWAFTIALSVPMLTYGDGWYFGSAAFLIFCGTASDYKKPMTGTVHYIGASGAIGLAAIGLLREGVWFPLVFGLLVSVPLSIFKVENRTWWIEIAWFVFLIIGFNFR